MQTLYQLSVLKKHDLAQVRAQACNDESTISW